MALNCVLKKLLKKSRIDYVFVNNDVIDRVKNLIVERLHGTHNKNTGLSDHRFLKCNFSIY